MDPWAGPPERPCRKWFPLKSDQSLASVAYASVSVHTATDPPRRAHAQPAATEQALRLFMAADITDAA